MPIVTRLTSLCAALLTLPTIYLLGLLAAAARGSRRQPRTPTGGEPLRLLVLVPAHNEEKIIGASLAAIQALDYQRDRFEVVVIADNCEDGTAEVSRAAGGTVLVRSDPDRHGKGWALAWALECLSDDRRRNDAVVFVDADCEPSPNLLRAIDGRLRAGWEAVQASYVVSNPHEAWSSALRYAAFCLMNWVRPLGKDALGLSCGILGTGFAVTCDALERHPWDAYSLSEDHDYHLGLVAAGVRVGFVPEASVSSAMPTTLRDSRQQNLRWEGGRIELIRRWTPTLLREGLRRRDAALVHAAMEAVVPTQSLLLAGNTAIVAIGASMRSSRIFRVATFNLLGQVAYVLGGLALVGAPGVVYRALLMAPLLAAWKLSLHARVAVGRGPKGWVATRSGGAVAEEVASMPR